MGCQGGGGGDQEGGVYDLAAAVHVADEGDGGDDADAAEEEAGHAGAVHAGLLPSQARGTFKSAGEAPPSEGFPA